MHVWDGYGIHYRQYVGGVDGEWEMLGNQEVA